LGEAIEWGKADMLSSFDPPLMEGADSNFDQVHRIIAEHVPGLRRSVTPATTPGSRPPQRPVASPERDGNLGIDCFVQPLGHPLPASVR